MEQVLPYVWPIIQTIVILVGIGISFGFLRSDVKGQGVRLTKLETDFDKMRDVMVALARQEERYNAMDARVLSQGQRIDSTAALINGRLEAINNIVAGHTAQLNALGPRRAQS